MKKVSKKNNKQHIALISLISFILFLIISVLVSYNFFTQIDKNINIFVSKSTNQGFVQFNFIIGEIFSYFFITLLVLMILYSLIKKDKKIIFFSFALLLIYIILEIIKFTFGRIRPENIFEISYSYPSRHTVLSIVLVGFLVYLFLNKMHDWKKPILLVSISLMMIVSISRIFAGVHWFSDVFGGVAFGIFSLFFSIFIYEKMSRI